MNKSVRLVDNRNYVGVSSVSSGAANRIPRRGAAHAECRARANAAVTAADTDRLSDYSVRIQTIRLDKAAIVDRDGGRRAAGATSAAGVATADVRTGATVSREAAGDREAAVATAATDR